MSTSSASITAGEIMDRSAVLMNDPTKTDYTYAVLTPFLKMALDELSENLMDSHNSPTLLTSEPILLEKGTNAIHHPENPLGFTPHYPAYLVEVQSVTQRPAGTNGPYLPIKRVDYTYETGPADRFLFWAWESQIIRFNTTGVTQDTQVILHYIRDMGPYTGIPTQIVGPANSRSYLAYKTAAYAAQFIGENPERAAILDAKAEQALERMESINNKGRQQVMTRHRPFRANWKARGGY